MRMEKRQAGQTLLEILLAFTVAMSALISIVVGVTTSLSNTQYTKNQGLANSYAQEGVAAVRQMRDSSWPDFYSKTDPEYCLPQNSSALVAYDGNNCATNGIVATFTRSVKLVHDDASCKSDPACVGAGCLKGSKVTVKVSWSDNKCPAGAATPFCHKVELITCFSNIDLKPTP